MFKTETHFKVHTGRVHGEKSFTCQLCDKKCMLKSIIERHITITHLRKQRFTCKFPNSEKLFATLSALKVNQQTHMQVSQRAKYPCDQCPETFLAKPSLSTHSKLHNGTAKPDHSSQN